MVVKGVIVERNPDIHRVIGIDSSSTGVAWTLLHDGKMENQGKIRLDQKKTMQAKLLELYIGLTELLEWTQPDHVFVEKSIFVKNPATARTLSYIVGAIMCVSLGNGIETTDVEPSTWKAFFGYRNVTAKFNKTVADKLGRIEAKKFCDKMRKSQTWRVIKHNRPEASEASHAETDNDISDSWGVALWGWHTYVEEITLEITSSIRYDLEELGRIGVDPP